MRKKKWAHVFFSSVLSIKMKLLTKHCKDTLNISSLQDIIILHITVKSEEKKDMGGKKLMEYHAAYNNMEKGYCNTDEEARHSGYPPQPRGAPPVQKNAAEMLVETLFWQY